MNTIKIQIKGHLKSLNNNGTTIIDTKGIKNKNKISYIQNEISHKLTLENNKIYLIRENKEFKNIFEFELNKKNKCYYLLKENNIEIDINIETQKIENNNNKIIIIYKVLDSNEIYEYKIEMR